MYKLPHRRILEREADDVGIKLTAKVRAHFYNNMIYYNPTVRVCYYFCKFMTLFFIIVIICDLVYFFTQACFDIREAVVFWATLRTLTEMRILPRDLPWISSHPDHGDREKTLNTAMVKVLELRNKSGVCFILHIFYSNG